MARDASLRIVEAASIVAGGGDDRRAANQDLIEDRRSGFLDRRAAIYEAIGQGRGGRRLGSRVRGSNG